MRVDFADLADFEAGPTSTYNIFTIDRITYLFGVRQLFPGFRINNPKTGITLAEFEDKNLGERHDDKNANVPV